MTPISAAINSLINGKSDVCCLCLNAIQEEAIKVSDTVVIDIKDEDCDKPVEEVLQAIFDDEIYDYIKTFNSLCPQCVKLAISYFQFIETGKRVSEYFKNVFASISDSFEYDSEEFGDNKSLFVSLNLENFTTRHCYDVKHTPSNTKAALKRFHSLNKIKTEEKLGTIVLKKEETNVSTNKRSYIDIPTKEMLLDKNNPELIQCKECHKEFASLTYLRYHFIRVHAPKKFKCPECPKTFGSLAYVQSHRNESHCTVVCSECGKTFHNRHTLRVHELGHNLTLVCPDCGRVYKNKSTFKKHIEQNVCSQKTRASPSDAKFTCDYCNKKYTQKMSLRVHIQYEHGNYKAHVCEWCGKKFWAQSRLKAHIVKHTGEKNFECHICGNKFVTKESCLYHTRARHTFEKPYKCPHCEATFLSASRRTHHVKCCHLGGTLECDVCHSKFKTRQLLLKHKKVHCNKKPSSTYGQTNRKDVNMDTSKPHHSYPSKSTVNPSLASKGIWKINKLEELGVLSFANVIDSAEIQIQNFDHDSYIDQQTVDDAPVYLAVSDDPDDFMKLPEMGS